MTVDGTVNGGVFRQFLERLIAGHTRKIFLILDGHPSHKAKVVKRFVEEQADRNELFFLPPSSPDLNPTNWCGAMSKYASPKSPFRPRTR